MNKKAITPLLVHVMAFFAGFVLLSGGIGPYIISHHLVEDGGFWLYGTLGKALLFAGVAFGLLIRAQPQPALQPWHRRQFGWLAAALVSYAVAWLGATQLAGGAHNTIFLTVLTHAALITSVLGVLWASFGIANILQVGRHYKQQLIRAIGAAVAFTCLLSAAYAAWEVLAAIVLHAVRGMLALTGLTVAVIPPNTLLLDKFGVTVAQTCSGVESIALFSGLYALIGLLDWPQLNHRRFVYIFPIALAGLFLFNILRVYLLIIGGYFVNPEITFTLFHTYAGMVFFIIYAVLFWKIAYRWLLVK